MVRAIYCEMLGYEASFSYIHAIKLAQQGSALEKRVGVFFVAFSRRASSNLREMRSYNSSLDFILCILNFIEL